MVVDVVTGGWAGAGLGVAVGAAVVGDDACMESVGVIAGAAVQPIVGGGMVSVVAAEAEVRVGAVVGVIARELMVGNRKRRRGGGPRPPPRRRRRGGRWCGPQFLRGTRQRWRGP